MDKTLVCGTGTPGSIPGGSTKKGSAKADFFVRKTGVGFSLENALRESKSF